jgi:transposase
VNSYAGIDWATKMHALCVVDHNGETLANEPYPHSEPGLKELISRMDDLGVCRVAIERPDGILVDRLLEAGIVVLPIHALTLKDTRQRFEAFARKSDPFDAFCLAELARTDSHRFRTLSPDSDQTRALRSMTRARGHMVKDRVLLASQLRAELDGFWPGASRIFHDVDSRLGLAFLHRYPCPEAAEELDAECLAAFLKEYNYRNHHSAASLLERLRSAPRGVAADQESEARKAVVLHWVVTLEQLVAGIHDISQRIIRATHEHPDAKVFLPLFKYPKMAITPAVLIAEIGDDRNRYPTAAVLASMAGMAPVAREGGKRRGIIFRHACNHRLRTAVSDLANSTRRHHPWAQGVYEAARERGLRHPHALRILGYAWVRVLWRCWQDEVAYDPARHGNLRRLQAKENLSEQPLGPLATAS